MTINLFYLSGNTTGGWVTYTAHLIYGLKRIGVDVLLFKVGSRTERKERPFGYDVRYRNVSLEDAVKLSGPSVIVALQKNYREKASALLDSGSWLVVHDPTEFANLNLSAAGKYIAIRKAVQKQVPGSHLVVHPYLRQYPVGTIARGSLHACSISRVDFDKHTEILLDANRLLPKDKRIHIRGFENRIYTRFKICPNYPEWEQSKAHYPRTRTAAAEICHQAIFSIDMSVIKGDGGGTQYTFMESIDAGSAQVLHQRWILPGDEMIPYPEPGANCFAVENGQELAELLLDSAIIKVVKPIVLRGNVLLSRHNPSRVASRFVKLLRS